MYWFYILLSFSIYEYVKLDKRLKIIQNVQKMAYQFELKTGYKKRHI